MKKNKKNPNENGKDSVLKEIIATLFFTIGIFSLLSLIFFSSELAYDIKGTMGNVGLYISQVLGNTFGMCSFVFPILMFYLSFVTFTNNLDSRVYGKLISGIIFLLSITTLSGIIYGSNSLFGYSPAGGWIGNTISEIFTNNVSGTIGTYIIVTILTMLSLFILTGMTVVGIVKFIGSGMESMVSSAFDSLKNIKSKENVLKLDVNKNREDYRKIINLNNFKKTGTDTDYESDLKHPQIVFEKHSGGGKSISDTKTVIETKMKQDYKLPPIDLLDPKIEFEMEIDKDAIYKESYPY